MEKRKKPYDLCIKALKFTYPPLARLGFNINSHLVILFCRLPVGSAGSTYVLSICPLLT